MTEKFKGIVLDLTRHSDSHNIVTLYTPSRGRVAFLSAAGSSKAARLRAARLQPLSVIEGDFNFKPNAELQRLGTFALSEVWTDIYANPVKQLLCLFISEFLNRLLRASMPDQSLWDYVHGSLRFLDTMDSRLNDFHIVFLSSLLPFAGIQPDGADYSPGKYFDMQGGVFTESVPRHRDWLGGDEARFASLLGRINFANMRTLRLKSAERARALEALLHYYGLHFPGVSNLKSLQVIREIFHS